MTASQRFAADLIVALERADREGVQQCRQEMVSDGSYCAMGILLKYNFPELLRRTTRMSQVLDYYVGGNHSLDDAMLMQRERISGYILVVMDWNDQEGYTFAQIASLAKVWL